MYEPIAFTYDADIYCLECSVKTFGDAILTDSSGMEDTEGNEPGAVFDDDESDTPQHCGTCRTFIGGALTSDGHMYVVAALRDVADGTPSVLREWYAEYSDTFDDDDWKELAQAWARTMLADKEGR